MTSSNQERTRLDRDGSRRSHWLVAATAVFVAAVFPPTGHAQEPARGAGWRQVARPDPPASGPDAAAAESLSEIAAFGAGTGNWVEVARRYCDAIDALREDDLRFDGSYYLPLTDAHARVAALPPAGLVAYRRRVDSEADRLLELGRSTASVAPLAELVRRFFNATHADEAMLLSAVLLMEAGQYDDAIRALGAIHDTLGPGALHYSDTNLELDSVRARLALALAEQGNRDAIETLLAGWDPARHVGAERAEAFKGAMRTRAQSARPTWSYPEWPNVHRPMLREAPERMLPAATLRATPFPGMTMPEVMVGLWAERALATMGHTSLGGDSWQMQWRNAATGDIEWATCLPGKADSDSRLERTPPDELRRRRGSDAGLELAVVGGWVIPAVDFSLWGIGRATGKITWQRHLTVDRPEATAPESAVSAGAVVEPQRVWGRESVFVLTPGGTLYAIAPNTGAILWQAAVGGMRRGRAYLLPTQVIVLAEVGKPPTWRLLRFDATHGTPADAVPAPAGGAPGTTPPAPDPVGLVSTPNRLGPGGELVLATAAELSAIDAETGAVRWKVAVPDVAQVEVLGDIVVAWGNGRITVLDIATGRQRLGATLPAATPRVLRLARTAAELFVGAGPAMGTDADSPPGPPSVSCLDLDSGHCIWTADGPPVDDFVRIDILPIGPRTCVTTARSGWAWRASRHRVMGPRATDCVDLPTPDGEPDDLDWRSALAIPTLCDAWLFVTERNGVHVYRTHGRGSGGTAPASGR